MKNDKKPNSTPQEKQTGLRGKITSAAAKVGAKTKKTGGATKSAGGKAKQDKAKRAISENRTELLFLIVNRAKTEYYADLLHSFDVNINMIVPAHGTADASMLAMLGFTDTDKSLIIGVIRSDKISDAFALLEDKFKTIKNGKGIAYTVPMTGVIGTLIYGFLTNNRRAVKDDKENSK